MTRRASFRELLASGAPLVLPAAHDALSARMIEQAGFSAFAISGSGTLAARYGLPDVGIAGLSDLSAAAYDMVGATSIACMVDGDDGYGDLKSVARTVRMNEALGVGALVIEDQAREVKRPGQAKARAVVCEEEIAAKLRAAVQARQDRDFWIIGRTDAYGTMGVEAALERGELFLRCGVDGLFVAGVRETSDLERIGRHFRGTPLTAVVYGGDGGAAPSVAELHAMGYTQIVYPMALLFPLCVVFDDVLRELRRVTRDGGCPDVGVDELRARAILTRAVEMDRWLSLGEEAQARGES